MDLAPIAYLGIVGLVLLALWYVRKGGSDDAKNKANTDVLKDLGDLSKPVDAAERDKLQQSYRRD